MALLLNNILDKKAASVQLIWGFESKSRVRAHRVVKNWKPLHLAKVY